jgi:hypothetical protein
MKQANIIQKAIGQLEQNRGIPLKWYAKGPDELDGKIELRYKKKKYDAYVEVKKELRSHQLPALFKQKKKYHPLMVVAEYIFPKIKEVLREQNIAYLETNGNIYFKQGDLLLWLDGQKSTPVEHANTGWAFTKTGLKLIFHFLLDDSQINLTYREIAGKTGVGFGNINVIVNDLKQQGFLIQKNQQEYMLVNKRELLEKWMTGYQDKLKPALLIGTFRFLGEEYNNWPKLTFKEGKTCWGGEPAGDILTNYLRPGEFTIYTEEKRMDLIKNYRIVPDEKGNIKVFQKFWQYRDAGNKAVPPILVYVDLMIAGDGRCIETAQRVYEKYLQNKF